MRNGEVAEAERKSATEATAAAEYLRSKPQRAAAAEQEARVRASAAKRERLTEAVRSVGGVIVGVPAGALGGLVVGIVIGLLVWIIGGIWMGDSAKGAALANTVTQGAIVVGAVIGAITGWVRPWK